MDLYVFFYIWSIILIEVKNSIKHRRFYLRSTFMVGPRMFILILTT